MALEIQYEPGLDEHAYARALLARGEAAREDRIGFYRGKMLCLTGSVGWFADHYVKSNSAGTPVFKRCRSPASPDGVEADGGGDTHG